MIIDTDDDDDDDDDSSPAVAQPVQQATQQVSSPVSADALVEEGVADNIDDIPSGNADQADGTEQKDPQQIAQDQAATINNNIDPVGNDAVVDDEEGKLRKHYKILSR